MEQRANSNWLVAQIFPDIQGQICQPPPPSVLLSQLLVVAADQLGKLGRHGISIDGDDGLERDYGLRVPIVAVAGVEEFADVCDRAHAAGLPVAVVHDSGRTQVPAGTPTCAAIGPAPADRVDAVTGALRLL